MDIKKIVEEEIEKFKEGQGHNVSDWVTNNLEFVGLDIAQRVGLDIAQHTAEHERKKFDKLLNKHLCYYCIKVLKKPKLKTYCSTCENIWNLKEEINKKE